MTSQSLVFKPVASVPDLKVSEGFSPMPGVSMRVISTGPDSLVFIDTASVHGDIRILGPGVATVPRDYKGLVKTGINVLKTIFGGGGGGAGGQKCTTHTEVTVDKDGHVTGFHVTTTCQPA